MNAINGAYTFTHLKNNEFVKDHIHVNSEISNGIIHYHVNLKTPHKVIDDILEDRELSILMLKLKELTYEFEKV